MNASTPIDRSITDNDTPLDPWDPGIKASDIPAVPNGPNPLETSTGLDDEFAAAPKLVPNRNDMANHLYELFPPNLAKVHPDALIEIAYADMAGSEKPDRARCFSVFNLKEAADFAISMNQAGCNIFVGPALRKAGTTVRASDTDAEGALFAWTDHDGDGDLVRVDGILTQTRLTTSMYVITGRTPHERGHLYFRITNGATADEVHAANLALKTLLKGDDVESPSHLMRLAGSINYPSSDKRSRGYTTELVALYIRKKMPSYTVKQLTDLAPAPKPSSLFGFDTKPARTDDEIEELLEVSREDGKWHNSIRAAIASMLGRGWSDSAIRMVCRPYCRDGYSDHDLDDLIDRGRRKWDRPDPEQPKGGDGGPGTHDYTDYTNEFAKEPPPPLPWLNMSNWDHEPTPERQWAIRDRAPLRQVGLFSGEGGMGKSLIELMKDVAHVTAKDWFGSLPEPGPAFYLGAEDDENELHARLATIAKHYNVTFEELTRLGLHVMTLDEDAVLCALNPRTGRIETTAFYQRIFEAAGDIKRKNISIDPLSLFFAGNEIDRARVYQFAHHMRKIARVANGSVTVLSHPSLAGMSSGSGISGSTAWHGAFRFRHYFRSDRDNEDNEAEPDNGRRKLEFKKNQYGPRGQTITLLYEAGIFVPLGGISSFDKAVHGSKVDGLFMTLLKRLASQGRHVSHKPTSNNYAPTLFAKEADAKRQKFRKDDFEAAMWRLFDADKIMVEPYGPPCRGFTRVAPK
jgi:RecA-family ATPase